MSTRKNILFIQRAAPYSSAIAFESLEAILVAGVFDQQVSVLFLDDGVYQLCQHNASILGTRNVSKLCESLPMYDIDKIYVSEASLQQRGLQSRFLCLPFTNISSKDISALISSHEIVVTS
ncbi:MAG: sulfurtransferase complex subunit TusC [Pseudomonadales bacterium]|nr:sulfurtransferase complex subunit TusC [Pseudomonadales bacterium]